MEMVKIFGKLNMSQKFILRIGGMEAGIFTPLTVLERGKAKNHQGKPGGVMIFAPYGRSSSHSNVKMVE